jgi:LemA protein
LKEKKTRKLNGFTRRKWLIVGAVIVVFVLMFFGTFISLYNGLVKSDIKVDNAWSQVENVYQRRADLIPNLVSTVEGARDFEKETLLQITAARSAWTQASSQQQRVEAANNLESAISRLLLVVENYPDLKTSQNFLALQDELANSENKVAVERARYNNAVAEYNKRVRTFPSNIIAEMFGFGSKTFFEAKKGSSEPPTVKFK